MKPILLSVLVALLTNSNLAQVPSIVWQKCYGGSGSDIFYSSFILNDSTYLIQGYSDSNDGNVSGNHGGPGDLWFTKINTVGNLQWQRCYGGSLPEGSGIQKQISTNSLLIVGGTRSNNGDISGNHSSNFDGWISETDTMGNILWQRCYGGTNDDGFMDFIHLSNSYLLVGSCASTDGDLTGVINTGLGQDDVWIIKIDSSGNIIWQKCYGGSSSDFAIKVVRTSDNGFLIGCNSSSQSGNIGSPFGKYDFWVLKIDSAGNLLWEKSFGGSEDDLITSVIEDSSSFILVGFTHSNNGLVAGNHNIGINTKSDFWILKLDSVGNQVWQKCYGGYQNEECYSIRKTYDGNYILCGLAESDDGDVTGIHNPGLGAQDIWLVKISNSGDLLWQKCLGGSDGEVGYDCVQLKDSSFLVTGFTYSYDGDVLNGGYHGNGDGWLVQLTTEPLGVLQPLSSFQKTKFTYNKHDGQLKITLLFNNSISGSIQLFDILGQQLFTKKFTSKPGLNEIVLEDIFINSGTYFYRIQIPNNSFANKFIVD